MLTVDKKTIDDLYNDKDNDKDTKIYGNYEIYKK